MSLLSWRHTLHSKRAHTLSAGRWWMHIIIHMPARESAAARRLLGDR